LTSHHIELVFTLQGSVDVFVVGGTDSETELVKGDKAHPFVVEYIGTGDVGGHVAANGVAQVFSTVRVEFTYSR
jgi:hypothetical protein